jgi:transposase
MAPYSMDLRTRVLRDWDAGMKADDVAAKYSVSRAWVHRLQQRRRETGSIVPRRQSRWRTPLLAPHLDRLAALIQEQPDRTLAELQAALGTSACLATIWRTVKQLGFTLKKNGTRLRARSAGRRRRPDGLATRHARD